MSSTSVRTREGLDYLRKLLTNGYPLAFTIGCLVSFRALYTDRRASAKRAKLRERQKQAVDYTPAKPTGSKPISGFRAKAQAIHNVLLTTFQEWEDTTHEDDAVILLPSQSTGIMTVDFERRGGWSGPYTAYNSAHSGADSAGTLEAKEASSQAHVC